MDPTAHLVNKIAPLECLLCCLRQSKPLRLTVLLEVSMTVYCVCVSSNPNHFVLRFSDDTVILRLLKGNSNIVSHTSGVDKFIEWCDQHNLFVE